MPVFLVAVLAAGFLGGCTENSQTAFKAADIAVVVNQHNSQDGNRQKVVWCRNFVVKSV
jgi:hypothetical protein